MKEKLVDLGERIVGFLMDHYGKVLSFLLGVLLTTAVGLICIAADDDNKLKQLKWVLENRYVEDVDMEALEDAAASAMVDAVGDRWSYYMTAEEYEKNEMRMNSQYVGIGISISLREDGTGYDILKVESDSPADRAGILAGDILIGVNDEFVSEVGAESVKNSITGDKGTKVELTVIRGGAEMKFETKLDVLQVDVAQSVMLEDNIGLVTIASFHSRCADETIESIEQLLSQGAEALIFDVRNNPGGYTTELIEVLDYLLPEGPVFRTENYAGDVQVDYSDADCLEIPMAVLVNGKSYSAAEFFPAALQEYNAAVIVGEKTTGKGYYQRDFVLTDGSVVHLSMGKYFTPNGVSLIGVGIVPDVEVLVDEVTAAQIYADTLNPMEDPQVLTAIDVIKSGK